MAGEGRAGEGGAIAGAPVEKRRRRLGDALSRRLNSAERRLCDREIVRDCESRRLAVDAVARL